jgi:hypothetical protein
MEHFFLSECEFQSRLLNAELYLATDEMEVPKFAVSSLEKAVHGAQRGIKEGHGSEKMVYFGGFYDFGSIIIAC